MNSAVWGRSANPQLREAQKIVRKNADLLHSIGQLLVVFNDSAENNKAIMVAMERQGKRWKAVSEAIEAGIGRNGFANPGEKREGDGKSPSGFFSLGQLFSYEKTIDTAMPYQQTTSEDKWIDDPESADYNRYVKGKTTAKSFENLKISSDEYKLCMVIEYNTNPVVKGMGSAIFMHLSLGNSPNPSSGCIVITPENMEKILKWMKPGAKPSVLMGTATILNAGLK